MSETSNTTASNIGDPHFPMTSLDAESTCLAIASAGVAAYRWHIGQDLLEWNAEASKVLKRPMELLTSGRYFASLLDPDNLTSRYDAVMNSVPQDGGDGVPYQIEYQLKANPETGAEAMWVEDLGRWFADRDGRPHIAAGMVRIITDRHRRDQQLSALSHTDPLTGLMNRTRLDEVLRDALGQASASEANCAFAIAAIRNLDIVNEAYGFEVADEVVSAMAQRLRGVMRVGDGIGRYAGSKFGIILNACADTELPVALERFLNAARDSVIETTKGPVWALLSIGAVLLPGGAATSLEARARAEESLSAALRQSSDCFVVHRASEENSTNRMVNARCATEIVECLKNNRFQLAFQPMVSAVSGEVTCHEALLRMRDEAGELVTASHLVPVAERLGLIRLVDRSVTQLALETLHRYPEARLSINISATTANDPRWNAQIIDMIETANAVADRMTVEITETAALNDLTAALVFLERLRATGCCVAIDDFGAGFTSFRNLRDLPIDVIKLDGSYCRNLGSDTENAYFARTLIEMAHHFGIRTVAEWVETEEDAAILTSLGIDFLQGNFLGKPSIEPPWSSANALAYSPAFSFDVEPETTVMAVDASADVREDPAFESDKSELLGTRTTDWIAAAINVEPEVEHPELSLKYFALEASEQPATGVSTLEGTVAAPLQQATAEAELDLIHFAGFEDSLSKLRQALDQLSGKFSTAAVMQEPERLAG